MIWTTLLSILPTWLGNRKELKLAEHARDLAIVTNQTRLAADKDSYNHEWEMASLKNQGKALRRWSFCLFALPILITIVAPTYGAIIWKNLELVPPWVVTVFISMVGGIWGISELKTAIPRIMAARAIKE